LVILYIYKKLKSECDLLSKIAKRGVNRDINYQSYLDDGANGILILLLHWNLYRVEDIIHDRKQKTLDAS
jgi:hypothetical protein